jgi:hypothetical protein
VPLSCCGGKPYISGKWKRVVKEVVVSLKSDVLATRTILRDLPGMYSQTRGGSNRELNVGLGDINIMKMRATQQSRYSPYQIVVTKPDRVENDQALHSELEHCVQTTAGGAKNVNLVVTHNDVG